MHEEDRNELVDKGYVDEEIPMWIERDEDIAKKVREKTKTVDKVEEKVDVVDEQTITPKFQPPPVPEPPSTGQGDPDPGSSLRIDRHRPTSTLSFDDLDAATQQRLRDANIVQLPDSRRMHVDERPDGSINMTPVNIQKVLNPPSEDEMPDMPGISCARVDAGNGHPPPGLLVEFLLDPAPDHLNTRLYLREDR